MDLLPHLLIIHSLSDSQRNTNCFALFRFFSRLDTFPFGWPLGLELELTMCLGCYSIHGAKASIGSGRRRFVKISRVVPPQFCVRARHDRQGRKHAQLQNKGGEMGLMIDGKDVNLWKLLHGINYITKARLFLSMLFPSRPRNFSGRGPAGNSGGNRIPHPSLASVATGIVLDAELGWRPAA